MSILENRQKKYIVQTFIIYHTHMKPFLKVILWICWIVVWVPLILLLFGVVSSDDLLWIFFIILGILWQIISWLWKNIDIVWFIVFFWFCVYVWKWIHELWDSVTKLDQNYRDIMRESVKDDNKFKELQERIEKLEKQLKSKKATQK